MHTPHAPHPLRETLLRIGQEAYLGPLVNLRVINLNQLLRKLQPLLTRRVQTLPAAATGAVSIALRDPLVGDSRVTLHFESDGVAVTGQTTRRVVEVDSLQLTNLLFGRDVPSRWCPWLDRRVAQLLDQVLPLDLYLFQMDHV